MGDRSAEIPRPEGTLVATRRRTLAMAAAVFTLTGALYTGGALQRDLWRTDEHRYAEVSREITAPGGSWWVLHLNGDPYAAKPPLFFWAVAAGHGPLGLPLPVAAVLPSLIAGTLCVALIFALGRRMFGTWGGLCAAAVLASSEAFLSFAIRAGLDALLTACVTLALYAYWRLEETREAQSGRVAWRFALLAGLAGGLGVLTKGPVALAIPAVVIAGHRLLRCGPRGLRDPALALAAGVALVPAALWLAGVWATDGVPLVREIALGHGVGHALGHQDKIEPFWFYVTDFPGGFLPWSVLLPAALLWWARGSRSRATDFTVAWTLAPLLLLSSFPAKRHNYALPLYPGAALLIAGLLAWLRTAARGQAGRALSGSWRAGSVALGVSAAAVGLGVTLAAAAWLIGGPSFGATLGPALPELAGRARGALLGAVVAGPAMLVAGGRLVGTTCAGEPGRAPWLPLGLGVGILLAWVLHPLESAGRTSYPFYAEVARRAGNEPLVAYGGLDFAPNWLTGRTEVKILRTRERAERHASRHRGSLWIVAERGRLEQLGAPEGARVVFEYARPLGPDLVLLHTGERGPGTERGS